MRACVSLSVLPEKEDLPGDTTGLSGCKIGGSWVKIWPSRSFWRRRTRNIRNTRMALLCPPLACGVSPEQECLQEFCDPEAQSHSRAYSVLSKNLSCSQPKPHVNLHVCRLPFGESLTCIVCAGTLAYGINMPCRSVIFAGDNVFLDPLQYRQMMGRAGRRGFDTLGHVIFFGIPAIKRESLMLSPVPRLHGNFPLTISLFMRAVIYQVCRDDVSLL